MTCPRAKRGQSKIINHLIKKHTGSTPAVGTNVNNCYACGQRYVDASDPIVIISFFNVLSSTIFLRDKYNLSNLPKDKRAQFIRYCGQYSRLFVCPSCDKRTKEIQDKIYQAYRNKKR